MNAAISCKDKANTANMKDTARVNAGASTSAEQAMQTFTEEVPSPVSLTGALTNLQGCEIPEDCFNFLLESYEKYEGPDTIELNSKILQLTDEVKVNCFFAFKYSLNTSKDLPSAKIFFKNFLEELHRCCPPR